MDMFYNEPIINVDELNYQIKWLEYIPDFWNMPEVYTKMSGSLKIKECERLLEVKKAKIVVKKLLQIKKCLSNERIINSIKYASIEKSIYNSYHKIVDTLNLDNIILSKITTTDLNEISSVIKEYDGYNEEETLNRINNFDNELVEEYALKLFNDKKFEYMVNKLMKSQDDSIDNKKLELNNGDFI